MNPSRPHSQPPPAASIHGHDILYVLFRRRWSIILLSLLGIGAGTAVFLLTKPTYESEAELLVKYVIDSRAVGPDGSVNTVSTPSGSGGDGILASEMMILSSFDLATKVVESVGETNIVPKASQARDLTMAAAAMVSRGLKVTVPPKSSILQLRFQHPDPSVARVVLSNIVQRYLEMHVRIHRSEDVLRSLSTERVASQSALQEISRNLQQIQQELGVASVEDARRSYREQISRTRSEIFSTEALLAEKRSSLNTLVGLVGRSTNAQPANAATNLASVPSARLNEYRNLRQRIDEVTRKEQGLLIEYTDLSPYVIAIRQRLADLVTEKDRMEAEFPGLTAAEAVIARPGETTSPITAERMTTATLDVPALEAKYRVLTNQLAQIQREALRVDERLQDIEDLTRRKTIEERRYAQISAAQSQADVDERLNKDKTANIRITQQPTVASPTTTTTLKIAGGVAGGGILFALALAFVLEWYLDQSVRRRSHVESNLRVPLFLTIPRLRINRRKAPKALPAARARKDSQAPGTEVAPVAGTTAVQKFDPMLATTGSETELGTWVETLRDRLIMHFEANNITHKPKLIGLTSCGHGAGVTTLAAALAASLSETGDGRVLYVDMNPHRGVAMHPFHRGECKVPLSQAFEGENREAAQIQDNLYVVSINEPGSRRVGVVPRSLAALMPKMKESDYDYIIFDFPPISQTSVTAKVAGLLDVTFLVLDSERTQTELAKNALSLMGEGKAKITAVLNKHRRYLPRRYDPDI